MSLEKTYISDTNQWASYSAYRGHDFPDTFPITGGALEHVLMTVEESVHYSPKGWDSDEDWFSLAGSSVGYVRLGREDRLFVITMFHELHCLRMLNLAFNPAMVVSDAHIKHCLGYLRQMALCAADLTLERAGWENRNFGIIREGATHVCRDWSSVYVMAETNYERWNGSTSN